MNIGENREISNILDAIRRLTAALSSEAIGGGRRASLTISQCKVLRRLAKKGPESASQLSRSLSMSPSNVTGIIDRLQNKGLVKRVPKIGDRRVMMITLTSAGKKTSESLPETAENRLVSGLENLEKSEVKKLSGALNTIIGLMKK